MEKIKLTSIDYIKENIDKIIEIFPECKVEEFNYVTNEYDMSIDFDKLLALLGGNIENKERYNFLWNGKYNSIKNAQTPSIKTLLPIKDKSLNWDDTENIYIEGNNLDALKLLCKTYSKKIKMIYIDPPYNTGHDFVYNDTFKENSNTYKDITSTAMTLNPEGNGRFHTNWLNMMYPRLLCAQKLLSDDGVLFISMADTELKNLLNICEEIFNKDNIEIFVWKKKGSAGNTEKILGVLTEYIVCCFKNKVKGSFNYQKLERDYSFSDDIGPYNLEGIEKSNLGTYNRPTMLFDIVDPNTGIVFKPGENLRWTLGQEKVLEMIENKKLFFDYKNKKVKRIKRPEDYEESENVFYNLLLEHGSLSSAKDELEVLLGNREIFDTPKPTKLIKQLLQIGSKKDSIILDFFSGSATTAQAVMEMNVEDGGNRKYIMVQIDDEVDSNDEAYKAGYRILSDIGIQRIINAQKKILDEANEKHNDLGIFADEVETKKIDLGFKVFKVSDSNIKPWNSSNLPNQHNIFDFTDTIVEGRTDLDIAYEIMLKYGVFNMSLKEIIVNNKPVYSVGNGYLLISLNNDITEEDYTEIAKMKPHCVVFKESGFKDDNVKMNATYTLERLGVEDVKCI